ncbi:A-kinase anchor protein 17A, partial [Bulinus truncatus]
MANTTVCTDTSEAIELFDSHGLYLKPVAKVNICVQLPQLKTAGKTISNWEVMEKLKHMVRPEVFLTLKIFKSTLEFIRLEGEIENKSRIHNMILKLDGKTIKLSGFTEILKVRAAEAKISFPTRHDWDSYFRDAKNMNEMKPGERPDTVHIRDLPSIWFSARQSDREINNKELKPSEEVVRAVFQTFGEIRCIDIPMLDPYRKEICANLKKSSIQTFSYGQDLTFECYIQYMDYISFVKAMDSLRGMKLLFKGEDKALTAIIKVDFDKSKHLSEKNIRRRRIEREKLEALERERLERARREREEEERKKEEERRKREDEEREKERKRQEKLQRKEERRKDREEKRRRKKIEKKQREEEERMQYKIALEER